MRCWDGNSFSNLYIFLIYDIELIALEIAAPIDAGEEEKNNATGEISQTITFKILSMDNFYQQRPSSLLERPVRQDTQNTAFQK